MSGRAALRPERTWQGQAGPARRRHGGRPDRWRIPRVRAVASPSRAAVSADGTAALPPELRDAGPLRVLLRVDDPWTVSSWPAVAWIRRRTAVQAPGVPASADPEEAGLSRFVAGEAELPELTASSRLALAARRLGRCSLYRPGARADLADAAAMSCAVGRAPPSSRSRTKS